MSLLGLLDSLVSVYRLDDGTSGTNQLGEPSKTPRKIQTKLRASIENPRMMLSRDTGAGDRPTGAIMLLIDAKATIRLNDILYFYSGQDAGTWWTIAGPMRKPTRSQHLEGYIVPYVGKQLNP